MHAIPPPSNRRFDSAPHLHSVDLEWHHDGTKTPLVLLSREMFRSSFGGPDDFPPLTPSGAGRPFAVAEPFSAVGDFMAPVVAFEEPRRPWRAAA